MQCLKIPMVLVLSIECELSLTYVGRGKVPAVVRQLYLHGMEMY